MKKTTFRTTLKAIRKVVAVQRMLLTCMLQKPREGFVVESDYGRRLYYIGQSLYEIDINLGVIIASLSVGP